MNTELTVVIPTVENPYQLDWCIRSLFMYTEFPLRTIIVNNSPQDKGRLDYYVKSANVGGLLEVVHMERNIGWMGAVNVGLELCDTPLFCMLNDDVVFIPGHRDFWRLLWQCTLESDVGAVGPCSNFVSGCQNLMQLNVPEVVDTKFLIGLCMVVKTSLLRELGGLDQALPGGDDLDLSLRIRRAGYKLRLRRDCYLHHFGQQTGKRLFGDGWDSQTHQEDTNNALIRKHGVAEWHDLLNLGWDYTEGTRKLNEGEDETGWISEKLQEIRGDGLNLGCGSMKYEVPGLRLLGVDLRQEGEHGTGGTKFYGATPDVVGDVTVLDFVESGSQDVLVAQHLLEHLVDFLEALERWWEVLRPGGSLFVTVPNHEGMNTILLDSTHVHAFTPGALKRVLCRCGFRVLECRSIGWGSIVCHAKREAGESEL